MKINNQLDIIKCSKILTILFAILIHYINSNAQNIIYSNEEKLSSKFEDYEILGKNKLGIVVYYYGSSTNQIAILDNKLNTIVRKDINIQSKSLEDVLLLEDRILITYVQNSYDYQYFKAITLNKNLNEIDSYTLDSMSIKLDNRNRFYTKVSPDNSKILFFTIIKNKGNTHIRFASFDKDFKIMTKNLFTINGTENVSVRSVKINNNGFIYGIFGHEDKWSNDDYTFNKYTILVYNNDTKTIYESDIQESNKAYKKLITDINLEKDLLYILCAYKNTVNKDDIGFYYRTIDLRTNNILFEKHLALDEEDVMNSNTFEFKNWRDKVFTLNPKKIIPRSDGGFLFAVESEFSYIIEDRPNITNYTNTIFGNIPQNIRTIQKNNIGDVMIFSINNNGSIDWKNYIYKSQTSENDDAYRASFGLFEANNVLKFIYSEDINNSGNFVEYNINPIGKYKKISLLNTLKEELNPLPKKAIQLDANSVLIPSESKRNLRFIKISY